MADQEELKGPQDIKKSYVIRKDRMEILALTNFFRIEGTAHFIPRARVSDFMNRTDISFIPLTDVTVYAREDGQKVFTTSFLCLNKTDITFLTPKGDISSS